ncbi:MAG: DNA translocase FtsK 4TM domain-containing protein [Cohaesibacter sp.]|jgi:S-DNA-T family DNA segregation ATPase FtsK/SpoIIIE|nr:DNA translocase FtsK 4TM domain-containing protein [Cohaesibacter sp.]
MSVTQPFETLHKDRDSALRRALRRNAYAATGLFGLILCVAIAAALATWHVADPSFSNATELPPRNVLGLPGAMISDLLLQTFGLGSAFLLIPPVIWFWRLVRITPMRLTRTRIAAWVGGLAAIAIAFSTIPAPSSWPLPLSLGGIIGDGFLAVVAKIDPHFINGLGAVLLGTGFCALGASLLLNSTATPLRQILSRRRAPVEITQSSQDEEVYQGGDESYYDEADPHYDTMQAPDPYQGAHQDQYQNGILDRSQASSEKKLGLIAVAQGAISHWLLSRKAQKRRPNQAPTHAPLQTQPPMAEENYADGQPAGTKDAMAHPQKPQSLLQLGWAALKARLIEPEDDGLDALANRLEPHLTPHGAPTGAMPHPHQQAPHPMAMAQPHPAQPHQGGHPEAMPAYGQDPSAQAHFEAGQNDVPWDENSYDPSYDAAYDTAYDAHETHDDISPASAANPAPAAGPVGMAPPTGEIIREPQTPVAQAVTNSEVQAKTVRESAGKRMVRAAKGNAFLRKEEFQFPPLSFLEEPKSLGPNAGLTADQLEHNARLLEGVLSDFGIRGEIIKVRPGPVVTLYELEPAPGIKSSRVIGLADDIARSMSAISARVAVVPGRNAIGIELPNARRETVYLRGMLSSPEFEKSKAKLPICLGKNISGDPVVVDLARMPHVLVAGTTGSGKSVSINTTIMSLLYRHSPEQCRLIMIDPKMLELSIYDGIPHLLTPVVTDPSKAVVALKWAVREMEQRYKNMSKMGVRNIDGFNNRVRQSLAKGEAVTRTIQTGFDPETGDPIYEQEELNLEPMPYIVIIVDEMADLMMVAGKDIEGAIQRLAQMARAAGIHLIMATQRPSVDVITGTIKATFPTRMSFQVTSKIDSRTILGEMGAEQLLGMGDMLYMAGGGRTQRVHGPFVADEEVEEVVRHLKLQGVPDYLEAVTEDSEEEEAGAGSGKGGSGEEGSLYDKAVDIVLRDRKASTSYIQRRLSIGYNRAATLIEQMEQEGVISPANHAGKREILVPEEGTTM